MVTQTFSVKIQSVNMSGFVLQLLSPGTVSSIGLGCTIVMEVIINNTQQMGVAMF
jgi:hypothetical protein